MSEVLTKVIVDCATGEVQELPLTAEEIAQREADAAAFAAEMAAREAEAAEKAAKKAAVLAALAEAAGLTTEEVEAALS